MRVLYVLLMLNAVSAAVLAENVVIDVRDNDIRLNAHSDWLPDSAEARQLARQRMADAISVCLGVNAVGGEPNAFRLRDLQTNKDILHDEIVDQRDKPYGTVHQCRIELTIPRSVLEPLRAGIRQKATAVHRINWCVAFLASIAVCITFAAARWLDYRWQGYRRRQTIVLLLAAVFIEVSVAAVVVF